MENKDNRQVYWIDCKHTKLYFQVEDDGTVRGMDGKAVAMPTEKFHDFLATARVLGLKTGKI